mgnify:FL=1
MEANFTHPDNNDIPHPEKVFLGSGELNLACSLKKTIIVLVILAFVIAFFTSRLFHVAPILFSMKSKSLVKLIPFCASAAVAICSAILNIVRHGDKYKWYATGRDFTIFRKNRPAITIFYKEVILVDYEPLKFLYFFNQGYRVRVQTTRDEYEFKYAFPRRKGSKRFEDTPFGLLARTVDDLRTMGLDDAIRDNGVKDYNKRSIEDVFNDIVGEQLVREREKER